MIKKQTVIIITGYSGSGKSTALAAFEDAGFYCVDNMPLKVVSRFLKHAVKDNGLIAGWAFVMDLRDRHFISHIDTLHLELVQKGFNIRIVFLEADEQALLKRYSQTRRQHPLDSDGNLLAAIQAEKQKMKGLRKKAGHIIDTTHFTVHELKFAILNIAQRHTAINAMAINVVSFGFKYGAPSGVDMMIDVRFLENPYFVPELKAKSGECAEVTKFVLNMPQTGIFLNKYLNLIDYLIPLYEKEGKTYLTIAVGCTGGRHRSVVIAKQIYDHIGLNQSVVRLIHRDIANE
ncbi:MAG: RNase adapter RapZ [Desulfobacteraceae bacterium]|nr:RNase adapter RapZ [Desulfobacteraceae bacterium]